MPISQVQCVVVTPEKAVMDEAADFVAVPMFDGELGVLPGRSPLIGRLGYGELRTTIGGATKRLFVDGGFVQIRDNVVTVLTPRALDVTQLNIEEAEKAIAAALVPAETPDEQEAKMRAQERARVQMRLAKKVAEESEL